MGGLITGDLGRSYRGNEPIIDELKRRWPITIELMVIAVTFSTIIAVTVGVLAAVYQDTWLDYLVRGTTLLGQAIPFFWVGTLIIIFLVTVFDWLPPLDMHYLWENPVENLKQMIIPGLVLAYFGSATSSRLVRSAMLEVLRQDYIRTARAKGLPEKAVIIRHALRNALIPVVTVKGAQMVALMGGSVIAESIFVVPGMGSLLIEAINGRDYIVTQTLVVIFATMVVSVNLIVDVTYAWLNPRIVYR